MVAKAVTISESQFRRRFLRYGLRGLRANITHRAALPPHARCTMRDAGCWRSPAGGKKQYYLDQEIALYLLGGGNNGRYYDASTGRFLSEDPTKESGGDADLFRYAGNDPINNLDPSGHDTKRTYHPPQKQAGQNPNANVHSKVPATGHGTDTAATGGTGGTGNQGHAGTVPSHGAAPLLASTAGRQKSPNGSSAVSGSSQGNNLAWIAALQGRPADTSVAGLISPSQSSAGGGEIGKYLASGTAALVQHPSALGSGTLQGLATTLNTVENAVDSVVNSAIAGNNLLNMGVNKIAGLVDHGAAPFEMVPSIPTSNWSRGVFVSHDPARPVEKAVTGTAIAVATTFGGGAAEDAAPALAAASDATKGLMGKASAIAEKVGGWIKGLFGETEEEGVQANKLAGDAIRDAIAAREAPAQIEQIFNTVGGTRRVDALKTGIRSTAIESKVGRTFLDARVRQELARDWWLRRQGQVGGVRWEFSRSKVTGELGPTATLLQKLQKLGFDVRINQ